jgi:hypothetical protein
MDVGKPEVGPERYVHQLQLYPSFLALAAILWFKQRLSASARALHLKRPGGRRCNFMGFFSAKFCFK